MTHLNYKLIEDIEAPLPCQRENQVEIYFLYPFTNWPLEEEKTIIQWNSAFQARFCRIYLALLLSTTCSMP